MAPRVYSVEEANAALPEVRRLVERVVDVMPELPEMHENVRIKELRFRRDGAGEEEQEALAQAVAALRAAEMAVAVAVRELESLDVTLKDSTTGLVDFLGERDGEMVELCWRLGEESVANWHRIGEGYPGRKPL
ncbi:MAG TPA: DUF2203 family protein [Candidatus Dormibacteraeota bacterium]|jgi:hypothetical protein|nr:DUF2203 family protein [Candidatus Dormibacteraeota bacterium]